MAVKRTGKIEGDIAEVGVYRGGSAKLICEAKGNKQLHLFDTFEGLPDLCEKDGASPFHKGQFIGSYEDVKNYLRKYSSVYFYKGFARTFSHFSSSKFRIFSCFDITIVLSNGLCQYCGRNPNLLCQLFDRVSLHN